MTRNFEWDGEKILESVSEEDKKHTPKDILNGLDNTRSEINKFENAAIQLEKQMEGNKKNMEAAQEFEKNLSGFEEKCVELQKKSILLIIRQIHDDCFYKAKKSAEETIAKDPAAYEPRHQEQLPYLDYQKLLATNEKMAEKISNRMIRQFLFEDPIFENPFKKG